MSDILPKPLDKDIIAFAGKKQAGKSTAAEALSEYETVSIADPIQEVVDSTFRFPEGIDKEEVYSLWDISRREAMQIIGSELFREQFGELFWIKSLLLRLSHSDGDKFVVDDVRFKEELVALEHVGAEVYIIERPSRHPDLNPVKKRIAKSPLFKSLLSPFMNFGPEYHRSELDLDGLMPDFVNDATEVDFRRMIKDVISNGKPGFYGRPTLASEW